MKRLMGLFLALTGCVYTFSMSAPGGARTIAIPVFLNESPRPGVELDLTRAVIRAVDADGRLRVVNDTDRADMLLRGAVKTYTWEPYTYDEAGTILSYRVRLKVGVTVENRRDTTASFSLDLEPWGTYDAETESEQEGLARAAEDLARQVLEKIFATSF